MDGVLTFNPTNENVRLVKRVVITPELTSGKEIAPSPGGPWWVLEFTPLRWHVYPLPTHHRGMCVPLSKTLPEIPSGLGILSIFQTPTHSLVCVFYVQ